MANHSRKTGFPEFFADTSSAENIRRQFIDAPFNSAGQATLNTGVEIAELMSILSQAFAASQRREFKRILESGDEQDSRIAAWRQSIGHADSLRRTALRGEARIQRALAAFADEGDALHGFVSDSDFTPLEGLTVRLTGTKNARVRDFSATSEADGYFRIPLVTNKSTSRDSTEGGPINVADWIADLLADLSQRTSAATTPGADTEGGRVEILKAGKLLYRDLTLVPFNQGSIYREYVLTVSPTGGAAETSQPSSDVPPSSASGSRATGPDMTKRSRRQEKPASARKRK